MDELRILNGLHRGATLPLHGAAVTLGSGDDADMALADHGIAALHALIEPDGAGGWRVLAEGGQIEDGHSTAAQAALALQHGQPVRLGSSGIWLVLAAQGAPWQLPPPDPVPAASDAYPDFDSEPERGAAPYQEPAPLQLPWAGRRWLWLAPLALLASLGAVAAYAMVARPAPVPRLPLPHLPLAPRERRAAAPVKADAATLALLFRQRLAEAELLPRFELDLKPGRWAMHADLDSEEQARFERILTAFVEQHQITFPVDAKVVTAEGMLPFVIAQVVSGANPSLVTRDGHRLYVGDDYLGMRVVAIEAQHVSFAGKRKIEVSW